MSKHGFSLISVLVAAGLMAVLALGMSSMLRDAFKGSRTMTSLDEKGRLSREVSLMLARAESCRHGFLAGATPLTVIPTTTNPGDEISLEGLQLSLNGAGTPVLLAQRAQAFGDTGFRVQALRLQFQDKASSGTRTLYTAKLVLSLQADAKTLQRQLNAAAQDEEWRLVIETETGGATPGLITSCSSEGVAPDCAEGYVWGKPTGQSSMGCVPLRGRNWASRTGMPPGIAPQNQEQVWPTSCLTARGSLPCGYRSYRMTTAEGTRTHRRCVYTDGEWRGAQDKRSGYNHVCTGGVTFETYETPEEGSMTLTKIGGKKPLPNEDTDQPVYCRIDGKWRHCQGRCQQTATSGRWKRGSQKCSAVLAGPMPPGYDTEPPEIDTEPGEVDAILPDEE